MDADAPLPTDVPTLQQMVRTLQARVAELEPLVETVRQLREGVAALKAKHEKKPEKQVRNKSERTKRPPKENPKTARPHGRNPLPADLPRREVVLDLTKAEQTCPHCGEDRECVGQTETEQLDRELVKYFVLRTIRKTYACQKCSTDVPAE